MKRILSAILAILFCICSCAQQTKNQAELDLPEVYRDENIVFWKLDDHTWIGSGNRVSSETLYIIEGEDKAVLLDAGTHIPDLDKIVAGITDKPVSLLLTHGHGDHVGAAGCFDELWINNADASMLRNYKGTIHHIENGQKFDLGGRVLEAYYTPGHTSGSVTFLELGTDTGYSGDAFGNTNLLIMTDLSTMIRTCRESVEYFRANGFKKFYNGHFWGDNHETIRRIEDIQKIVEEVLAGTLEGEDTGSPRGLNRIVTRDGVRVNYNYEQAVEERKAVNL